MCFICLIIGCKKIRNSSLLRTLGYGIAFHGKELLYVTLTYTDNVHICSKGIFLGHKTYRETRVTNFNFKVSFLLLKYNKLSSTEAAVQRGPYDPGIYISTEREFDNEVLGS